MRQKAILCLISLLFVIVFVILSQDTVNAEPAGWSDDIRLTFNDDESRDPAIAVWGDTVHVVFGDEEGGGGSDRFLWYKNSTDNGKTWGEPICLNSAPTQVKYPAIAVKGSNIHVVWHDEEYGKIAYINSSDNGNTWSNARVISPTSSYIVPPDIALNGSNIHVVYISRDFSETNLTYLNSTDSGVTWSSHRNLTTVIRDPDHPAIAVNGSNVHIVWEDTRDKLGNIQFGDVFYINSSDNGETWSDEINLTPLNNNPLMSGYPDIAVNESNIHVVYMDDRYGITQVHYRRSEDGGLTWTDDVRLSNSTDDVAYPAVTVDMDNNSVVWTDYRDGNYEIYYKNSSDNGKTWSDDLRLTFDPAFSANPDVALNGGYAHVVWMDMRDSNTEIYYKRNDAFVDLSITSDNITFSDNTPNIGVPIKINATVENIGEENVSATIEFYDGDPDNSGVFINSTDISVNISESANTTINWAPTTNGTHYIYVKITNVSSLETNLSNNVAYKSVIVNKEPELIDIPSTYTLSEDSIENQLINLSDYAKDDLDSWDELSFAIVGYSNSSIVSVLTFDGHFLSVDALTGPANDNWTGTIEIVIEVTDTGGLTNISNQFTVTVTEVNDAPIVINPIINFSIEEDSSDSTTVNLTNVFFDSDNSSLYYTCSGNTNISIIIHDNGSVNFVPLENWTGQETITFYATDNLTSPVSDSVTLTITSINDAPAIISTISDFNIDEDTLDDATVNLTDIFYDVDNATLYYSFSGSNNISVIIYENGGVTFIPAENWSGMETIMFYATDNLTAPISEDVTITVIPINDPPTVINPISDFSMFEDTINSTAVNLSNVFSDVDNATLHYYFSGNVNIDVIINHDGSVSFTPVENWTGTETITFYATDNLTDPISEDVMITVIPINDPPVVIYPISDFNMVEDTINSTAVNLNNVFYDVDNATLYYYFSGNVNINVIINQDGSVSFTPAENWTGSELITFYATDNLTDPISEDVTITVIPINDPPVVINPILDFSMFEDTINSTAVNLTDVFFDCDNVSLRYFCIHRNISVFISNNGTVAFILPENWTGIETLTFYATDNLTPLISEDVTITVIGINDPPVITALSPSNNSNNFTSDTIYFNISVLDVDSDSLTYLWEFDDGTTSTLKNATHQFSKAGIYNVSITVSDGSASDIRIVTIVVEPATVDDGENGFNISVYLWVLLPIIIVVVLLIFFIWRKSKAQKDDSEIEINSAEDKKELSE